MVVGIVVTLLGTVWYGRERLAGPKPPQGEAAAAARGGADEETPLRKGEPARHAAAPKGQPSPSERGDAMSQCLVS